jgi:recombination protein RecA
MAAKKNATKKAPPKRRAPPKKAPAAARASDKVRPALRLAAALGKKFGSRVLTVSDDQKALAQIHEFIPSGVDVLDNYVIGRGGYPVGRMSEVFGEEGCGKTALAMHSLASVQRVGGIAVLADAEQSFDAERAEAFGIDLDELVLLQPANLEELFEMAKETLRMHNPRNGPMMLAWDSIASTRTKHGLISEAGVKRVGDVPLLMSEELPKILQLLPAHRAHMMMINQVRAKIGVVFGSNVTTPGGNAPKFYSSLRLQFFGGKAVKVNDRHVAKIVTVMAVKNRLRAPFAKARVRFDYATGYNNMYSTVEHAKSAGLIKPREDGFKGKGKAGAAAYAEAMDRLGWNRRLDECEPHGIQAAGFEVDDGDEEDAQEEEEDAAADQ